MKNVLSLLIILFAISVSAQRKPKIKGNRVVTQVSETLPDFNAIILQDDLDVVLKKSFGPGYEIEADDNLIDILKFKVEDSTLIISSFYDVTKKKKLDITVNFVELKAITLQDGKVKCDQVISNDVFITDLFGKSKLDVRVSADVMDLNLEENSSGDFNLDVDSLNVTMRGRSDAFVYSVSGTKNINLEENANLKVEGATDTLVANLRANSKLRGQKLRAGSVDLNLNESADAHVNVFEEIVLVSNGKSKTFLFGNPQITIKEFLDSSQLIKKPD